MANKAFTYQEKINGKDIKGDDLRCPKCNGNTLVLYGKYIVGCREVIENGEVTDRQVFSGSDAIDIERIDCLPCSTSFWIEDPQIFSLECQVLDLQKRLSKNRPAEVPYLN